MEANVISVAFSCFIIGKRRGDDRLVFCIVLRNCNTVWGLQRCLVALQIYTVLPSPLVGPGSAFSTPRRSILSPCIRGRAK